MTERLQQDEAETKQDKARAKGAYTRTRTKLMMIIEGRLSSNMQVMERFDFFLPFLRMWLVQSEI